MAKVHGHTTKVTSEADVLGENLLSCTNHRQFGRKQKEEKTLSLDIAANIKFQDGV